MEVVRSLLRLFLHEMIKAQRLKFWKIFIFCSLFINEGNLICEKFLQRTSDNCSAGPTRSKRGLSITSQYGGTDETVVDVFSQLMTVFDIDDPISTS